MAVRINRGLSRYHLHVQSVVQYQSVSCGLGQHVIVSNEDDVKLDVISCQEVVGYGVLWHDNGCRQAKERR